jgi:hypothetical protein
LYIDMIHHYMPNSQRFLFLDKSHGVGGPAWNGLRREFLDDPRGTIGFQDARVRAY